MGIIDSSDDVDKGSLHQRTTRQGRGHIITDICCSRTSHKSKSIVCEMTLYADFFVGKCIHESMRSLVMI